MMEKKEEIFKQVSSEMQTFFKEAVKVYFPQGDTFFAEVDTAGKTLTFGYRNDEPLKFGEGESFKLPFALAENLFKKAFKEEKAKPLSCKREIKSCCVWKTGVVDENKRQWLKKEEREEEKTLILELFKKEDRIKFKFLKGPIGFEEYDVLRFLKHAGKKDEFFCICAGTINSWPECYVSKDEIVDFLLENLTLKEEK